MRKLTKKELNTLATNLKTNEDYRVFIQCEAINKGLDIISRWIQQYVTEHQMIYNIRTEIVAQLVNETYKYIFNHLDSEEFDRVDPSIITRYTLAPNAMPVETSRFFKESYEIISNDVKKYVKYVHAMFVDIKSTSIRMVLDGLNEIEK